MTKQTIYIPIISKAVELPLFVSKGSCGFTPPADDYLETNIDIFKLLISNPETTFLIRATGESMTGAGILDNDILIVDRSLKPNDKDIVVAILDREFLVKRLYLKETKVWLCSENKRFPSFEITPETDCQIWGVVTNTIHTLR